MKNRLIIFILLILFVFPVFILFIQSFAVIWRWPHLLPEKWSLHAIIFIAKQNKQIITSLLTSTLYSLTVILLTIIMTYLPAKVFATQQFSGKKILEILLLAPAILPFMAFSLGAHYFFIHIGLADTFWGVVFILAIIAYPYMLRSLTTGFMVFNEQYLKCAKNLGANPLQIIFQIELPMILPSVIAGSTIVFLVSFSNYFLVFLIGGGIIPSFSGYIMPFLNSTQLNYASLLTLIFLIIPLIFYFFLDFFIITYYRKRKMIV
ncbi:MAG: ABC transporter permease subunit [Spirochaetes bacterium]|nr:ABC transporter permease subunit [Spirochaetota bacterium]